MEPDPRADADSDQGAAFRGVAGPGGRTPLIALTLAALAVLGVGLLARESNPERAPAPAPTTSDEASAAPTPPAPEPSAAVASSGAPSRNPAASPVPLPDLMPVEPGPIQLIPAGAPDIRIGVNIPANGPPWYRVHDGWYLGGEVGPETFISVGAWQVESVFVYPCRWSGRQMADPELMQSPQGLARALSTWWGQDPTLLPYNNSDLAPLSTLPREDRFQGLDAQYLEVLIPSGLSFSSCDGSQLILWEAADGTPRPAVAPGELHRLWVFDLEDTLAVIDFSTYVTPSEATVRTMDALIDSITIARPDGLPDPTSTP